jgi:hypothetical protein
MNNGIRDENPSKEMIPEDVPHQANGSNKWKPKECIPKVAEIPKHEIPSE